ncbi:DUF4023 family protein [Bacillus pinisoli]|nr:DUF4023 family protein [Bacillus pinisoli]
MEDTKKFVDQLQEKQAKDEQNRTRAWSSGEETA